MNFFGKPAGGDVPRLRAAAWIAAGAVALGAAAGVVTAIFGIVMQYLTDFRLAHLWLLFLLGAAGAAIVWCVNRYGGVCARGIALVFETGHGGTVDVPLRLVPLAIAATWVTHLFGGSSGREGVAVQIGASIGHNIGRRLPVPGAGRVMLVAGMAAGFAGLFRTPFAATFFALEVLTAGALEYEALFPAMIASLTASAVSGLCGLHRFSFALSGDAALSFVEIAQLLVLGALTGLLGAAFAHTMHTARRVLAKAIAHPVLRAAVVGSVTGLLLFYCWNGRYAGLSTQILVSALNGDVFPWDFAFKALFTAVTLAVGFMGGEVVPLFITGASFGAVFGPLFGLPAPVAAALGCAATFGGATNTLIAPILIGAEMYGWTWIPYFFIVCATARVCNGNSSIYTLQKLR